MPEAMPRPAETCGASTRGIRLGDNPPYYLGPCVLRKDHDGPVHQAEDGAEWMGDVGSDQPTTPRRDVPDELTALIVPVLRRPCPRCDGNHTPTGVDVHCSTCMDSGSIGPVYAEAEAVEYARDVLAAVLPAHARRVREGVAAEIYTEARKWAANAQASSTVPERERRFAVAAALTKAATGVERGES